MSQTGVTGSGPSPLDDGVAVYRALLAGELSGDDALAASQAMLRSLMDSTANAVFWKDRESRYLGCNRVFASFAGADPEMLIGKCDRDMPWAHSDTYDAAWFIDHDREVMETGEPRYGILEQLQRADGRMRWVLTNKVPLRDLDGAIIGVLGTFEDVTDRRRAEEELRQTLAELDERVRERTNELVRANESLKREIEDRVRLQAEEKQQRAYAEALRATAAAMTSTLHVDEVTEQVVAGVERLISNDLTAVILLDEDGVPHVAELRVGVGHEDDATSRPEAGSLSVVEFLQRSGDPVVIDEPAVSLGDAGAVLGAPMAVGGRRTGYVVVESSTPGFFSESHAERLRTIADQAAAAISNAQLAEKASEVAATDERQRLSRELHDAVNQTLWTASLTADSLLRECDPDSPLRGRLERLRQLTAGALAEMRALLLEMRPSEITRSSLADLIDQLLTALECRKTFLVTADLQPVDLEPAAQLAFYRIAQEAISNIARHSHAARLDISLTDDGPATELCISDDGDGFDPAGVPPGHMGLSIMQERADRIGAELTVASAPGQGTRLCFRLAHDR